MIASFILILAALMIGLVTMLFALIPFVLPVQIIDSITYFFGYLTYLGHVFPVNTLMQAFGTLLLFYASYQLMKICIFVFRLIPIVGSNAEYNSLVHVDSPGYSKVAQVNRSSGKSWFWRRKSK